MRVWLHLYAGVLLPGGDLDHFSKVLDAYFLEVKFLYQYALQQTDKGDEFFLWGTCQGFQMLCACAADSLSVVEPGFVDTACVMMPLNFTKEAEASKMLGATTTPPHIVEAFKSYPSTLNVHRFGVTPATFLANPNVSSALVALSTNVDGKGREFVSTMEHRSANIFGVQWHPEWSSPALRPRRPGACHPGSCPLCRLHALGHGVSCFIQAPVRFLRRSDLKDGAVHRGDAPRSAVHPRAAAAQYASLPVQQGARAQGD